MARYPGPDHSDELAAFLALASEGSFKGAGRSLSRHASIVTKRVQSLEARLGTRLVERTTRQVRLTDAGIRLAERLALAAEIAEQAQEEASSSAQVIRGTLRLSLPAAMGRLWLAPMIPGFLRGHPDLRVEANYTDGFVDLIAEGYDAAIRIGSLRDSRLVARKLSDHRRILCASPDYLSRRGTPVRPEDLSDHDCLEFTGLASFPTWHLADGGRSVRIEVRGRLRGNDPAALLEAARAGVGILGAGEWLAAGDVAAGTLVPVLPTWTFDVEAGVYLVRPSARHASARVEAFVRWIETAFDQGPPWSRTGLRAGERGSGSLHAVQL